MRGLETQGKDTFLRITDVVEGNSIVMCNAAGGGILDQYHKVQLMKQDDDGAYYVRVGEAEDTQRHFANPLEAGVKW